MRVIQPVASPYPHRLPSPQQQFRAVAPVQVQQQFTFPVSGHGYPSASATSFKAAEPPPQLSRAGISSGLRLPVAPSNVIPAQIANGRTVSPAPSAAPTTPRASRGVFAGHNGTAVLTVGSRQVPVMSGNPLVLASPGVAVAPRIVQQPLQSPAPEPLGRPGGHVHQCGKATTCTQGTPVRSFVQRQVSLPPKSPPIMTRHTQAAHPPRLPLGTQPASVRVTVKRATRSGIFSPAAPFTPVQLPATPTLNVSNLTPVDRTPTSFGRITGPTIQTMPQKSPRKLGYEAQVPRLPDSSGRPIATPVSRFVAGARQDTPSLEPGSVGRTSGAAAHERGPLAAEDVPPLPLARVPSRKDFQEQEQQQPLQEMHEEHPQPHERRVPEQQQLHQQPQQVYQQPLLRPHERRQQPMQQQPMQKQLMQKQKQTQQEVQMQQQMQQKQEQQWPHQEPDQEPQQLYQPPEQMLQDAQDPYQQSQQWYEQKEEQQVLYQQQQQGVAEWQHDAILNPQQDFNTQEPEPHQGIDDSEITNLTQWMPPDSTTTTAPAQPRDSVATFAPTPDTSEGKVYWELGENHPMVTEAEREYVVRCLELLHELVAEARGVERYLRGEDPRFLARQVDPQEMLKHAFEMMLQNHCRTGGDTVFVEIGHLMAQGVKKIVKLQLCCDRVEIPVSVCWDWDVKLEAKPLQ